VHLASIGVRKLTEFEVDDDKRSKSPMKEEQIHSIPSASDTESALPPNESEIAAEFQEKRFQFYDKGGLKIGLRVLIFERKKFEKIRIFDFLFWRHYIRRELRHTTAKHF
jgi:hypothetical protein